MLINPQWVALLDNADWYDQMAEGAIWFGMPPLSDGNTLHDVIGGNHATISGDYNRTRWTLNDQYKTAFGGMTAVM